MTVYRDVMSMAKISLSWPEKLKSRKIGSACVLSLMYDGKDLTMSSHLLVYFWSDASVS